MVNIISANQPLELRWNWCNSRIKLNINYNLSQSNKVVLFLKVHSTTFGNGKVFNNDEKWF